MNEQIFLRYFDHSLIQIEKNENKISSLSWNELIAFVFENQTVAKFRQPADTRYKYAKLKCNKLMWHVLYSNQQPIDQKYGDYC